MPEYNVFFRLQGPGGTTTAPNSGNPVAADGTKSCPARLADGIPELGFGMKVTGVVVEQIHVPDGAKDPT